MSLKREKVAQLFISKLKHNLTSFRAPCVPLMCCRAHSTGFCTQKRTRTTRKGWHLCVSISEAMICEETLPYPHFTPRITKPSAFKAFGTVALIICCYHSPTQPTEELLCMIHLPKPSFSTTWSFCQSSRDASFP